ncbi:hypothetical protein [Curtobacterium sp. NPDC089689]|uniref:hypothetical protein n=1 Tax=Curtobacterium sp. NPDC089689 TaxID=3363968 RepID=UPI003816F52E
MSALDRALIAAAVAMTPAAHRDTRREQWSADVQGAAELDLSPTALAFGAFTTAVFHRRADRRTTWGTTMTAVPGSVRRTPHSIPTIPVLLALGVLSYFAGSALLGLLQRYNGFAAAMPVYVFDAAVLTVVPGISVCASLLLVTGVRLRRRVLGGIVALLVGVLWFALATGIVNPPVHAALSLGIVAAGWLAASLVVLRRPGWTWSLLLLPVVAAILVFPLSNSVYGTQLAYSIKAAIASAVAIVPFLVALLAAIVAGRMSTDSSTRFVAPERALVDKSA